MMKFGAVMLLLIAIGIAYVVVTTPEPWDKRDEPGTICPVHGETLRDGLVPVRYGLPLWAHDEKEFAKLQEDDKHAPCARTYWHGGCCVTDVKWARVSYCTECRRVLAERRRASARIGNRARCARPELPAPA